MSIVVAFDRAAPYRHGTLITRTLPGMEIDLRPFVHEARFFRPNTSGRNLVPTPISFAAGADVPAADPATISGAAISGIPGEHDFRSLCVAFRATGGTARGDDLVRLLEDQRCGDFVTLAKLIVSNKVFAFNWRNTLWVPMFQFELRDLSVKHGHRKVLAELFPVFNGWTLAAWFARPNSWLDDRRPVDMLDSNLAAVLEAARVDRFIAKG